MGVSSDSYVPKRELRKLSFVARSSLIFAGIKQSFALSKITTTLITSCSV